MVVVVDILEEAVDTQEVAVDMEVEAILEAAVDSEVVVTQEVAVDMEVAVDSLVVLQTPQVSLKLFSQKSNIYSTNIH